MWDSSFNAFFGSALIIAEGHEKGKCGRKNKGQRTKEKRLMRKLLSVYAKNAPQGAFLFP